MLIMKQPKIIPMRKEILLKQMDTHHMRKERDALQLVRNLMRRVIIVNPKDEEEMALTLNGKKKKLKKEDFIKLAESIGIEKIIVGRLINKYIKLLPKFKDLIFDSFLNEELQKDYFELLNERLDRLRLK